MSRLKVVVIGNGIAGFSAASTVRRLNEHCDITMVSAETTPLYSACVLPDYISGKIPREKTFVKTDKDYQKLGIQTLFGRAVREIDPNAKRVMMDHGRGVSYDRLILATGSEAIGLGEPKKGVFKIKTLRDADEILRHKGKRAVVVGSGAIGIEVAIALCFKGYEVTIIEMMGQVLPLGLDYKAANKVKEILEENGIKVFNSERAKKVLGEHRVEGLVTEKRELECDTLIWAVGVRPKVELAKRMGIKIGERGGISVDSHMETNIPEIYACGDCVEATDIITGKPALNLFWHNANRQGSVAGQNCTDLTADYGGSQNILNVDVFGHHVVGFGYTEASFNRLKDNNANDIVTSETSIIENEENGSYYRLVIVGDRCVGGQFINMKRDLGLIWSIMVQRKSIKQLLRVFEDEELLYRRPWLRRVRPFLKKGQTKTIGREVEQ